jgi:hypothetical protein
MDDPTRWRENDASNGNAPYGAPDPKRGPHFSALRFAIPILPGLEENTACLSRHFNGDLPIGKV